MLLVFKFYKIKFTHDAKKLKKMDRKRNEKKFRKRINML